MKLEKVMCVQAYKAHPQHNAFVMNKHMRGQGVAGCFWGGDGLLGSEQQKRCRGTPSPVCQLRGAGILPKPRKPEQSLWKNEERLHHRRCFSG